MTKSHSTPPVMPPVQPQQSGDSGLSIASMVLGVISLAGILLGAGVFLGIPAIILGIVALTKKLGGKGLSIAGIVTGSISLVLTLAFIAFIGFFIYWGYENSQNTQDPHYQQDYKGNKT